MSAPIPPSWLAGRTPSGQRIVCDGCRTPQQTVDPETQVYPVRRPELWPAGTKFIVCPPLPDGSHPCLDLAVMEESLDTPPGPDCGYASCRPRVR
jgi:hypothetical protein